MNSDILETYKQYHSHTQNPHVSATLTLAQIVLELIDSFQEDQPDEWNPYDLRRSIYDARKEARANQT